MIIKNNKILKVNYIDIISLWQHISNAQVLIESNCWFH